MRLAGAVTFCTTASSFSIVSRASAMMSSRSTISERISMSCVRTGSPGGRAAIRRSSLSTMPPLSAGSSDGREKVESISLLREHTPCRPDRNLRYVKKAPIEQPAPLSDGLREELLLRFFLRALQILVHLLQGICLLIEHLGGFG